jgi:FtsH-binding integral membrane protein
MYCGKDVRSSRKGSNTRKEQTKNGDSKKKQSRYLLNDPQRKLFLHRIIPFLIIGCTIWLASEILFSYLFKGASFTHEFIIFYVCFIIADLIALFLFFITARKNQILTSIFFYFIFTYLAGAISLPIIIFYPDLSQQVNMFIVASLEGTIVVALLAIFLRKRYLNKGNVFIHVILFLILLALAECAFFLMFSIENWILTLSITLPYLLIVSLIIIFYGAIAVKNEGKQSWSYILFKVLGALLVSLLIAVAIAILVLIIICLAIICGDGNFDLSGLSFGGSGSRKKKKKNL